MTQRRIRPATPLRLMTLALTLLASVEAGRCLLDETGALGWLPCRMAHAGEGEEESCDICGKALPKRYTRLRSKGRKLAVCPRCVRKAPRCARCGLPIKAGEGVAAVKSARETPMVCPHCVAGALRCDTCKRVLVGKFTRFQEGDKHCPLCMAGATCHRCKRPLTGTPTIKGGQSFCADCAEKAAICGSCGKACGATRYRLPFLEEEFCADCWETREKCAICSRPLAGRVIKVGGKRPTCPTCLRQGVFGTKPFETLLTEVRGILDRRLDLTARGQRVTLPIHLEISNDVAEQRKGMGYAADGRELGLCQRQGKSFRVWVLSGLPEPMAYETLAHEWAHAWCDLHARKLPAWQEEGLCQWFASHVLREKKLERGLRILHARDDDYGRGYRHFKAIEDRGGIEAVLRAVAKSE